MAQVPKTAKIILLLRLHWFPGKALDSLLKFLKLFWFPDKGMVLALAVPHGEWFPLDSTWWQSCWPTMNSKKVNFIVHYSLFKQCFILPIKGGMSLSEGS